MITPRTKTIDTTRGECRIRALKAKEQNTIVQLQSEMLRRNDDNQARIEIAMKLNELMRSCCDMPQADWDELEAWEPQHIYDEVRELSYSSMEKN